MLQFKLARERLSGLEYFALQWTSKNKDEFLAICSKDYGVSRISTYPFLGWLFFPTDRGELLVRKNGWIVRDDIGWCSVNGGDFKKRYNIHGFYEDMDYEVED